MVNKRIVAVLLLFISVQCSAQDSDPISGATKAVTESVSDALKGFSSFITNIASPKTAQLRGLIEKKAYDEALTYYESEREFFSKDTKVNDEFRKTLAEGLNASREPALAEAARRVEASTRTSSDPQSWGTARYEISTLRDLLSAYESLSIFRDTALRGPVHGIATTTYRQALQHYVAQVPDAFAQYDHFADSFFSVYPVPLDGSKVMRAQFTGISRILEGATPEQLAKFKKHYSIFLNSEQSGIVDKIFVSKLSVAEGGLFDKLDAVRAARNSGFNADAMTGFAPIVVRLDSPAAGPASQLAIINGDIDGVGVVNLDGATDLNGFTGQYLVLLKAHPHDVTRKVVEKRQEQSTVQIGTKSDRNPAYVDAQARFIQAQSQYNTQRIQNATTPSYGWAAAIAKGLAEGVGAAAVDAARENLARTPPAIETPVFKNYKFSVSKVEATREGKIGVWVIDRSKSMVARHEIPWMESKTFEIAYNIQEQDPNLGTYRSRFQSEGDIDVFEKHTASFNTSWIFEQLKVAGPVFNPMQGEATVLIEANATKYGGDNSSTFATSRRAELPTAEDKRFDSVVVITNPKGGLGSGFYVAPNLVVTNNHVVEGSTMAEVKLHNGAEAVGRVIKADPGLDLALIKVSDIGQPVQFANAALSVGQTVEAVGHPSGLEYTMTRGIVSAIRAMANPLVAGAPKMMVIQTDAAISPGNSGGPLFAGSYVVGVNSQKLVRRGVEGVGFAIHYAEVLKFIK